MEVTISGALAKLGQSEARSAIVSGSGSGSGSGVDSAVCEEAVGNELGPGGEGVGGKGDEGWGGEEKGDWKEKC